MSQPTYLHELDAILEPLTPDDLLKEPSRVKGLKAVRGHWVDYDGAILVNNGRYFSVYYQVDFERDPGNDL